MYFWNSGAPNRENEGIYVNEIQNSKPQAQSVHANTRVQDVVCDYTRAGTQELAAFQQLNVWKVAILQVVNKAEIHVCDVMFRLQFGDDIAHFAMNDRHDMRETSNLHHSPCNGCIGGICLDGVYLVQF